MEHKTKIEKNTKKSQPTGCSDLAVEAMALRHAHIEVSCEPPNYEINEANVEDLLADLESDNGNHARRVLAQYAFKLPLYEKVDEGFEHSLKTVKTDLIDIKTRYALERKIKNRERWGKVLGVATRIAGVSSPRLKTS